MQRPTTKMIDISPKPVTHREATASGRILLRPETLTRLRTGHIEKGDPLQIAVIAAIQAAKLTPQLLSLCHPIPLEHTTVETRVGDAYVELRATVTADWKTGVEMEALTAVSTGLLAVWDVVKKYEKDARGQYPTTRITDVRVETKVKEAVARG